MGIRSGRQFLGPLRDGRQMRIDGELVEDVRRDLRFAAAAAHTWRSSTTCSTLRRKPNSHGFYTPAAMPLWTVWMMFPRMFVRMCEIIQTLGEIGRGSLLC
jgi:aromatic ring hydroxylase